MATQTEMWLDRVLKIRPGEAGKVALMALYSFCAVGAVVVGRTVRDTMFLAAGGARDRLPIMYIVNSIAVAVLSYVYARFADKRRRDKLNTWVAGGWAVVMVAFFFALKLAPRQASTALYVAVEAMGSLVVIQFWTFAQDVFHAREAKRLFGLIGAGSQLASVAFGLMATPFVRLLGTEALLFVCAANLAACGWLASYLGARFGTSTSAPPKPPPTKSSGGVATGGLRALMTPHLISIAGIAVLSALAVNLVDYQFKAAAEVNLQGNKQEMGAFFGRFTAICGALALAVQMGLTGRLLERYGILASLLPLPSGLLVGSIAAWGFPGSWASNIAKGSDSIFRYTLNDASMQLLYVPVPAHQRGRAKALIDGILKPIAGVLAGLLLVALGRKGNLGPALQHRADSISTALIVLLVVGWVVLLVRGRREYVASLLDTLQRRRLDASSGLIGNDQATINALTKVLRSNDALAILHALEMVPHVQGRDFGPLVAELLDHPISSIRAAATEHFARHVDPRYALKVRERLGDRDPWCVASAISALCAIEREKAIDTVRGFLDDPRPAIRAAVVVGLVRHAGINGILEAADELKRQLKAPRPVERELAANVLGALQMPTFYNALVPFLEDPSEVVRRAALVAAGRLRSPELLPHILPLLPRADVGRDAIRALVAFGPGIERPLGEALMNPALAFEVRRALPPVLARLGTIEAAEQLEIALGLQHPPLRAAAAKGLARMLRRRPDLIVRRELVAGALNAELDEAELMFDIQQALELPPLDRGPVSVIVSGTPALLSLALREERDRAVHRTITLLEVLYPSAGLDLVSDNLRSELPAQRANAVEVMDNTVRDELKKRLMPLIEDRLLRPAPPPRPYEAWLSDLIRGPHAWIACCAARVAGEKSLTATVPALEEGLRSPASYVRESCAVALATLAPDRAGALLMPLRDDPAPSVRRAALQTAA